MSTQDLLFQAVREGGYTQLEKLLNAGADPNIEDAAGNTPLYYSLAEQEQELADLFRANGDKTAVELRSGKVTP